MECMKFIILLYIVCSMLTASTTVTFRYFQNPNNIYVLPSSDDIDSRLNEFRKNNFIIH